jgi:hypothetical protein
MLTTPRLKQIGERFHYSPTRFVAVFECTCGSKAVLGWHDVQSGKTTSCGCHRRRIRPSQTHGMSRTRTYQAWLNMRARCLKSGNIAYSNYGGRGITVCEKWNTFQGFLLDMGECPKGLTIERSDTNGNYCKDNCVWATYEAQARNTRRNKLITLDGETKCLQEWANDIGISRNVISARLRIGWSVRDALTTPVRPMNFDN